MPYGEWRRKGNRKGETLWSLLFNIFNEFLGAETFHDNADIALGGVVLAHGTANIADQFFGWHPRGGAAALGGYALAVRQPAPPYCLQWRASAFGSVDSPSVTTSRSSRPVKAKGVR